MKRHKVHTNLLIWAAFKGDLPAAILGDTYIPLPPPRIQDRLREEAEEEFFDIKINLVASEPDPIWYPKNDAPRLISDLETSHILNILKAAERGNVYLSLYMEGCLYLALVERGLSLDNVKRELGDCYLHWTTAKSALKRYIYLSLKDLKPKSFSRLRRGNYYVTKIDSDIYEVCQKDSKNTYISYKDLDRPNGPEVCRVYQSDLKQRVYDIGPNAYFI